MLGAAVVDFQFLVHRRDKILLYLSGNWDLANQISEEPGKQDSEAKDCKPSTLYSVQYYRELEDSSPFERWSTISLQNDTETISKLLHW